MNAAEYARLMALAIEQARASLDTGDVPVGAVVINASGEIVGVGKNTREAEHDPTGHAEIVAIRQACEAEQSWRLTDHTLIVTLEPCVMCAGAILAARIPRVIFGAWDDKAGSAGSVHDLLRDRRLNHQVEVIPGIQADECGQLLTDFFRKG